MTTRSKPRRPPIVAKRVRRIGQDGFPFIPNRFLRDGFFAALRSVELRLYIFLILAGGRDGLSFYHYDRICALLELSLEEYIEVRNALIDKDLIAFDGTRFQVLSLPQQPKFHMKSALKREELAEHDPATIRQRLLYALQGDTPGD